MTHQVDIACLRPGRKVTSRLGFNPLHPVLQDGDNLLAGRKAARDHAIDPIVIRPGDQGGETRNAGALGNGVVAPGLLLGLITVPRGQK